MTATQCGALGAVVGCVLLATACAPESAFDRTEGVDGLRGLALETPLLAPEFTLVDTEGQAFDFRARTAGSLSLVFFGYTHCPDICPVQMSILDAALSGLSYADRSSVNVVFVTTDPARDTPERLRAWLDRFDPSFVGLVGELERVNEVQAGFKLPAAMIEISEGRDSEGHDEYFVGHATPVVAVTGDGTVRALYPSGVRQTDWQHDLPLLLEMNATAAAEAPGARPGA